MYCIMGSTGLENFFYPLTKVRGNQATISAAFRLAR